MPIHLRAQQGDYAANVLCPGDPLRAKHIAMTMFASAREVNSERGMLGYTGTFEGRPISVQSTGMGGASSAIVFEELIMLGAQRIIRVGTCGGLQPTLSMADLVIAMSATPLDSVTDTYTNGEPHAPTASWRLVERAVNDARANAVRHHVGPIASSDVFYDPDHDRPRRLAARGHLSIEMEAATLYTIAALRGVEALAMMTVSDLLIDETPVRIADEELVKGVDTMMRLACRVATSG